MSRRAPSDPTIVATGASIEMPRAVPQEFVDIPLNEPARELPENYQTQATMESPRYLLVVNIILPLAVIGYALGIFLGPLAPIITLGSLALVAFIAPSIQHAMQRSPFFQQHFGIKPPLTPEQIAAEAEKPNVQRASTNLSTATAFTVDMRITFAAGAFALTFLVLALAFLHPAGAIVGTSVLELIKASPAILPIWASIGALVGTVVGYFWKKMAFTYAERRGYTQLDQPKKSTAKRVWYLGTIHDTPLYVRIFAGISAGTVLASVISLWTGLSAPLFAAVAGSVLFLAVISPSISSFIEARLPQHWQRSAPATADSSEGNSKTLSAADTSHLSSERPKADLILDHGQGHVTDIAGKPVNPAKVDAEESPRYWFTESSSLDMPWYARLFLGGAMGLALGSMLTVLAGPSAMLITPIITIGLTVGSPAIFRVLQPLIQRLKDSGLFKPVPHGKGTFEAAWYIRVFTGAAAGAALFGAITALGAATSIGLGIGLALPILAWASPMLFAGVRNLTDRSLLLTRIANVLLNPTIDIKPDPQRGKHFGHAQWYVRFAIGAMLGGIAGGMLAFTGAPLLAPIITLVSIGVFWIVPPTVNRVMAWFKGRTAASAPVTPLAAADGSSPNPLAAPGIASLDSTAGTGQAVTFTRAASPVREVVDPASGSSVSAGNIHIR